MRVVSRILFFTAAWVIAYIFYTLIVTPALMNYNMYLPPDQQISYVTNGLVGIMAGVFMGLVFSFFDSITQRIYNKKLSFGLIIVIRVAVYCVSILIVFVMGIAAYLLISQKQLQETLTDLIQRYLSLFSFSILISIILGFIMQIGQHIGSGNLLPLFLGKYSKPQYEERIFMFMDMRSSTTIAEKLGHALFSQLIQDCFYDLNTIVFPYKAEIYKYVGDEVILVWDMKKGASKNNCLHFYYRFLNILEEKKEAYEKKYGIIPEFKAGLNSGMVTVTEVGNIKREIAFYGDVLNTAARIQSVCNEYKRDLLISETLMKSLSLNDSRLSIEPVGEITLRGKEQQIKLFAVAQKS